MKDDSDCLASRPAGEILGIFMSRIIMKLFFLIEYLFIYWKKRILNRKIYIFLPSDLFWSYVSVNWTKSDYKMRQNPTIMFPNLPACYSGDFGSEANLFKFWVLIFYRNKILSKSPFLNVVFWIWYWNTNSILNQKNRKIWDSHWMLKIIGWRKYFRFPSYLIRQRRWRLVETLQTHQ